MKFSERIDALRQAECFVQAEALQVGIDQVSKLLRDVTAAETTNAFSFDGKNHGFIKAGDPIFNSVREFVIKALFIKIEAELASLEKLASG